MGDLAWWDPVVVMRVNVLSFALQLAKHMLHTTLIRQHVMGKIHCTVATANRVKVSRVLPYLTTRLKGFQTRRWMVCAHQVPING